MPSTRSASTSARSTEESVRSSEDTSRDWSMNTPSDSATMSSAEEPMANQQPRRSPLPAIREELQVDDTHPALRDRSQPELQSLEQDVAVRHQEYMRVPVPGEELLQRTLTHKSTRDLDAQSHSSQKKREQAHARMMVAMRDLEVAEARSRLARAELELVNAESEEEDCVVEETTERRTQEVEKWCVQTRVEPDKQQKSHGKASDIQQLAQAIKKLSEKSCDVTAPKHLELPSFSGSCEEWLAFRRSYEDTAASYSHAQNLTRFRRALQGKARQAVQSLLFTAEDPRDIIKGLEARFGRPGAMALAELDKMKGLPRVSENPNDICIFASLVRNAVETIKALKKPQYLSSPETTKAIVDKMTSAMRYRWYTYHRSRKDEQCHDLEIMEAFLEGEAEVCGDYAPPEDYPEQKKALRRPVHTTQGTTHENYFKKSCPHCENEHYLLECYKFKNADIEKKWEIVKKAKICFKCLRSKHARNNCKAPVCKQCGRWHHSILHADRPLVAPNDMKSTNDASDEKVASVHNTKGDEKAYLKMVPVDLYGPRGYARVLALLDEGSTITLLDATVAKQIGAEGSKQALSIETVGGKVITKEGSQRIHLMIKGAHRRDKKPMVARTIDDLQLSEQNISEDTVNSCLHLKDIGRQLLYPAERPRLLIGQDNWGLIVTRKLKKGKPAEPVASLTNLGWVLHGYESGTSAIVNFVHYNKLNSIGEDIDAIVKEHFNLESLGIRDGQPTYDSDRRAIEILKKTTRRLPSGQYEAGLLWKNDNTLIQANYNQAFRRLINIEKKLDKNQLLKISYEDQIYNLLEKGYAEKAPTTPTEGKTFYLPHFAVEHPVKKKPRIVFDAAAKFGGKSLNDVLLAGPDLLQSLFGVLLRFREGPVAVMADIQDMFLRVKVRDEDRDSLRFLWRGEKRHGKPEEYRMTSIVFGAASSPATAIFVMNKNAEDFNDTYPEAVKAISRNHYMDDYLQSFTSASEASTIAKQVQEIHAKASFHLKGWASNIPNALANVAEATNEDALQLSKEEKTLGLRWLVKEDMLAFNVGLRNTAEDIRNGTRAPTKREVTSAVMSTFDPMGFATPVLVQGKKLIQHIWRSHIDWDETIDENAIEQWRRYLNEIAILNQLKIPRCISPHSRKGQLHTFTDASEEAYAAVVYWRTNEPGGKTHIAMIAGKARVTPTKPVSIPRLELQAALLGCRMAASIEDEMELEVMSKTYWTDSSTVLQWIKAEPRRFNTFVANRLAEIEEKTKPESWRWVPTKDNPADDATRGTPADFNHKARWFQGPDFLYQPESEWPYRQFKSQESLMELKTNQTVLALQTPRENIFYPEKYSSWHKLLRVAARVIAFIDKLKGTRNATVTATRREDTWKPNVSGRKKTCTPHYPAATKKRAYIPIDDAYINHAKRLLIITSQYNSFLPEVKALTNKNPIENSSKLKRIDIYMGEDGIIKLRSRTMKFKSNAIQMNPAILCGREKIAQLIVKYYHEKYLHGNAATVINEVRQRYWIIGLRATVKAITYGCQWCKMRKKSPVIPPMGDLPIERLNNNSFPFTCSAVDLFGPMQVTIGRRTEKRWGALFTCLTTRAIHLELVPSLSTSSMMMALRRLAARRGTPSTIFSDNGTNFVGANHELQEAAQGRGIKWKFIPPGCPNMGGAWERLVRSVKTALMAVLEEKHPPEEVLYTLLTEVEHIVNSRPLTPISPHPEDEEGLTPNHFLIGRSCGMTAPGEFDDRELIGRMTWKTTQKMADHFWKRWVKEYLPLLMPRKINGRTTCDPQEGDIVLIADATLPRNTWPRGEVIKTYPGPDGRTRILDVRTTGGVLRRASRRVVVLVPAVSSHPGDVVQRTVGETVSDE